MSDVQEGRLFGFGRVTWDDALTLLDGFSAMWADLDGWHVDGGPLPEQMPLATHVWAWDHDGNRWARLRIDSDAVVVGLLAASRTSISSPEPKSVDDVEFVVTRGVPWGDEQQIPPRGDAIRHLPFEVAGIVGTTPIDFVRLTVHP